MQIRNKLQVFLSHEDKLNIKKKLQKYQSL